VADTNRGVVHQGSGSVTVEDLDHPKLRLDEQNGRKLAGLRDGLLPARRRRRDRR
jgi:hypothetical protein